MQTQARRIVDWLACALGCCTFGFAGLRAARIGYADFLYRQNTLPSLEEAVRIEPRNADWRTWLSEHIEHVGGDPEPVLLEAAKLKPADSAVWIRLGLRAEFLGDRRKAEEYLLRAAQIDRLFEPRWTLANYYFRQNEMDLFWTWVRSSFEMAYGDRRPLFTLCWRATSDAEQIRRNIPERKADLKPYLAFLLDRKLLPAAGPVARTLARIAEPEDVQDLLPALTRLISGREVAPAIEAWNALLERQLLPYSPVAAGGEVTNGEFRFAPLGEAFDWRGPRVEQVSFVRTQSPPGFRFNFNGNQPESCELLWQPVPLHPGRRYQVRVRYRTESIALDSGLRWQIGEIRMPDLSSDREKEESASFVASDSVVRLALKYDRRPGTVRIRGSATIYSVRIEPAQ